MAAELSVALFFYRPIDYRMTVQLLLQGFAVGAVATFPLGAIGLICLQRILTQGPRSGVASATGIILGTALWCVVAVQGLGWLAERVNLSGVGIRLVLGSFLIFVAVRNLRHANDAPATDAGSRQMAGQFCSTFLISLPNPVTVITVTAVLAAFGIGGTRLGLGEACVFSVAVFAGGMTLWLLLARVLMSLRRRLGEDTTRRVRRALSWLTLVLGIGYLVSVLFVTRG